MKNQVRIIAGKWRGRKVAFPVVAGLRPTHDRIRETLFNWIQQTVIGANCLDLFSGSGALGFEALSRGASHVTFVDASSDVARTIKANAASFNASDDVTILNALVGGVSLKLAQAPFDIVFLDPPFDSDLLAQVIPWLEINHYLSDSAYVYIEAQRGKSIQNLPSNWESSRYKSTSTIDYYLFTRKLV